MMKKTILIMCLFLLGMGNAFVADAVSARCGVVSKGCDSNVVRCPAVSTVRTRCGVGGGLVTSETQLDYLKVVVTARDGVQKFYILRNPPGGIADYPAEGIKNNPWVIQQLELKNAIGYNSTIEVAHDGYGMSPETPTFADLSAQNQQGTIGNPIDDKSLRRKCEYTRQPQIVDIHFNKCNGTRMQICIATGAYCRNTADDGTFSQGKANHFNIFCMSKNNRCPSPNQCAFLERVSVPSCAESQVDQIIQVFRQIGALPIGTTAATNYDENGHFVNDKGPLWHDSPDSKRGGGESNESVQ